jgi:hypothetical protein
MATTVSDKVLQEAHDLVNAVRFFFDPELQLCFDGSGDRIVKEWQAWLDEEPRAQELLDMANALSGRLPHPWNALER